MKKKRRFTEITERKEFKKGRTFKSAKRRFIGNRPFTERLNKTISLIWLLLTDIAEDKIRELKGKEVEFTGLFIR